MSYLITGSASVQAVSGSQDFQTLLRYSLSALESDASQVIPLSLTANTPTEIALPSLQTIQLIAVKSSNPIRVSTAEANNEDVYALASHFQLFIRSDGTVIQHLKLLSTIATTVEVVVCGTFT